MVYLSTDAGHPADFAPPICTMVNEVAYFLGELHLRRICAMTVAMPAKTRQSPLPIRKMLYSFRVTRLGIACLS